MKKYLFFTVLLGVALFITPSCDQLDPNAPKACFEAPEEVYSGVPAEFSSSCSENAVSFQWNFGDGGTSSEANPEHIFAEAGNFTVSLTVTMRERAIRPPRQ